MYKLLNCIPNLFYIIRHIRTVRMTKDIMAKIKLNDLDDVIAMQSKFEYVSDPKWFDWQPWPVVMFLKNFRDDCDGAAVLGKWSLDKINKPSTYYKLTSKEGTRHLVTLSDDGKVLISNGKVWLLHTAYNVTEQVLNRCSAQTGKTYYKMETWG